MEKLINIIKILRPKQWAKNAFIFFPLLFSGQFTNVDLFLNCVKTFAGFCLISSSMYVLNDLFDLRADQHHPKKSQRPLFALKLNPWFVGIIVLVLMFSGLRICLLINDYVLYVACGYVLLNLSYNLGIKRIVIFDVIFIAMGFHLRVWAGGLSADIIPSVWLQMCVFILALFLGFTKRRHELALLGDKAGDHRDVLGDYNKYLLDQIIIICSTLAIVFYGLYTISAEMVRHAGGSRLMIYSIAFVIYGIFRYLYLVHVKKTGDDPSEILLSDLPLIINIVAWIAFIGFILYVPHGKLF